MSTPPLFFVGSLPSADTLVLDGDEGRHAAKVKRIGVGEIVTVSDGYGAALHCQVTAVRPDGLTLSVQARSMTPAPSPRLTVVQALPKGDRAELAVEALTELGVDEIIPWSASRSITRWDGPRGAKALEKWRRTAREAAKQSRRPWFPLIAELASTAKVATRLRAAAGFVLHESATQPLATAELPMRGEIVLVVGPEGGVSEQELACFVGARARPVRLGEPVLRTSTAGAAALAAISVRLARWS